MEGEAGAAKSEGCAQRAPIRGAMQSVRPPKVPCGDDWGGKSRAARSRRGAEEKKSKGGRDRGGGERGKEGRLGSTGACRTSERHGLPRVRGGALGPKR